MLPLITDLRPADGPPSPGEVMAPGDLAVARVLGALTPSLVGSSAPSLVLSVEDPDGWVLSVPGGWRAVFGRYSPDVHPVGDIPLQVQCLRALLTEGETKVGAVLLALGQDRCGTFTSPSPSPAPSGTPARSPGPGHSPAGRRTPAPGRSAAP